MLGDVPKLSPRSKQGKTVLFQQCGKYSNYARIINNNNKAGNISIME
jgi:hypothetical protein